MAGKDTVTVRKTGRVCVFSLYFKALDRKGVCKVLQNNFLFVCLITDKSIMREKKGTNSLSKLLTGSSQTMPLWEDVCADVCLVSTAQTETTVFHTRLQGQPFTRFLFGN